MLNLRVSGLGFKGAGAKGELTLLDPVRSIEFMEDIHDQVCLSGIQVEGIGRLDNLGLLNMYPE